MELWELDQAIKAVCPILGVSKAKRIDFAPSATQPQKDAAQAIADAFDFTAPSNLDTIAGSNYDGMDKAIKAALLVVRAYCNGLKAGTYTNKTIADVKADFITAWKALP